MGALGSHERKVEHVESTRHKRTDDDSDHSLHSGSFVGLGLPDLKEAVGPATGYISQADLHYVVQ